MTRRASAHATDAELPALEPLIDVILESVCRDGARHRRSRG